MRTTHLVSTFVSALLVGNGSATPTPASYASSSTLPSSLPASAPYNYLAPAMYLSLTVKTVIDLGHISSGGRQLLGPIVSGNLISEPSFEPQFSAIIGYANDYLTADPGDDGVSRPHCLITVFPDDGDTPFLLEIKGVQFETPALASIVATNTTSGLAIPYGNVYSVWTPVFTGGSKKYKKLQNSVFVCSETVSDSETQGEFLVGMKISKVFNVNTTITIGNEFP